VTSKFFRRLLRFLGIIKPDYATAKRARVFVDGREVAFWKGEDVKFGPLKVEPIQALGRLDVLEIVDAMPEVTVTRTVKGQEWDEYMKIDEETRNKILRGDK
jgi:hypothetical protein